MDNPLISIILPTYNWKWQWLEQSIDSVLNQTYKNFELIIINDASTNNIEDTILKYQKRDWRIVYLKNEKNLKLTKTLNRWIAYSKWEYIARIDDDDIWINQDKLEKQIKFMDDNTDYWICWASEIINIDEEWKIISTMNMRTSDFDIRNSILQSNQFAHSSLLIRKSILDEVWVYNPKYNKAEDYELWCRIGIKSKFANLNGIWLKYRINTNWVSIKNQSFQKRLSFKVCLKYRKYYPNFYKALLLRSWDCILPEKITNFILNKIKH